MREKILGKITHAEFGRCPDRPFLLGLQLGFEFKGSGVYDGAKYTVNISESCKWERIEKLEALEEMVVHLNKVLEDANVNYVSELINKPVEVTIEKNTFKDFKILTEVI